MGIIGSLKIKSEAYHMHVHVLLGIITSLVIYKVYDEANLFNLMVLGICANILPDIDHLFFIFLYGRKTDYAKIIKKYLKKHQVRNLIYFIKYNHKLNNSIYSHNILTIILICICYINFGYLPNDPYLSSFFLSWMVHYLYDIFEDLMFFGKLNKNWLLKFDKSQLQLENFLRKDKDSILK